MVGSVINSSRFVFVVVELRGIRCVRRFSMIIRMR